MPYARSMREPSVPTPIQRIYDPRLEAQQISLLVKRDDLVHPAIPGNKWRKLKYNLAAARTAGQHTLLTFGGAYSNHIYAIASAGRVFDLQTIGVIRGEEHLPLNKVLDHAVNCGMTLTYMDRATYRQKNDKDLLNKLRREFGEFYLIPEGGTNCSAVQGCAEIVAEISEDYDYICCPVGTGGTLAGLISGLRGGRAEAIGFSALKGGSFLNGEVRDLLRRCNVPAYENWRIMLDYHFGGFAKKTNGLVDFVATFTNMHGIPLDPIYTGKMMYGLFDLVRLGFFPSGSTVVALHTGGVDVTRVLPFDSVTNREEDET